MGITTKEDILEQYEGIRNDNFFKSVNRQLRNDCQVRHVKYENNKADKTRQLTAIKKNKSGIL
jgi:hypothetical protein